MSQIIPFDPTKQLPAHLMQGAGALSLNDAAEEFASVKFPVISVKNSRFHVKRDGEKTMIMRPKDKATDPDEPASYIEVVILNIQKSKTFYAEGYTDGSEDKPDCFSNDGITPDSSVTDKQCETCALCPHNAWGSGKNDKGEATAGKACSDVQRLAIAAPGNMDDPMMLRVPPASLKNLAEMSKKLSKHNVPLNGVVTQVSFDPDATGVVLTFKPVGYLDADQFTAAQALMNDDLVLAIVGKSNRGTPAIGAVPEHIAKAATEAKAEVASKPAATPVEDPEAAKKAEAKAKKLAAAKKAAEEAARLAAEAEAEDSEPAAPAEAKPAATKVASADNFDAELDELLK